MASPEIRDPEKVTDSFRESPTLLLSEDQALEKARGSPNEALPIFLTYAPDDRDNPRNWPRWRKWYITCMVSMLNVFTYVEAKKSREIEINHGLGHGVRAGFPRVLLVSKRSLECRPR